MEEDYYELLGIGRNASDADIQRAYRSLARKYHPDVNPDDKTAKEKFQKIQKAYDVLSDSEKRELYDRYGSSFDSPPHQAGGEEFDFSQIFGGGPAPGHEGPFGDLFRRFGGAANSPRGGRRRRRGSDLRHEITVPFHAAVKGGETQLSVQRPSGKVENITVKIPAGIESGKTIRLRGQGEPVSGGTSGDLLIKINIAPHPCFRRSGRDLEVTVPVTLAEAALGGKVDLPTPIGTISLTIPPCTSSGKRLRVKGHGIQSDPQGDLFAEIQIALPTDLDKESQLLIRKFSEKNSHSVRAELRW